jgi:hypothetical protein
MEIIGHKEPIFYDMFKVFYNRMTNLLNKVHTIPI